VSPGLIKEARPRTAEQIATLPDRPAVVRAARARGITEIVHFTTMSNMIGILRTSLLCWSKVRENPDVEKVYAQNSRSRWRDAEWVDYVNLSVSRINRWMFGSSRRWHPEALWVVLAFDIQILGHPGVVFTTTNNGYSAECLRAEGRAGFERLFSESIAGYNGRISTRAGLPECHTTDHGAEVLYPFSLEIDHLRCIYAKNEEDTEQIAGVLGGLDLHLDVIVDPQRFRT